MSDSNSQLAQAPKPASFWISFWAILGGFALFAAIVIIAWVPLKRAASTQDLSKYPEEERWRYDPVQRAERLKELRSKEVAALTTYAVIDKSKGVVQIPVEEAMEITVREINAKRAR